MKGSHIISYLSIFLVFIIFLGFEPKKIHVGVTEVKNRSLAFQNEIKETLNEDLISQDSGPKKYTTFQLMLFTIKNPVIDEKLKKIGFIKISENEFCRNGELIKILKFDSDELETYLLSWTFPKDKCINLTSKP